MKKLTKTFDVTAKVVNLSGLLQSTFKNSTVKATLIAEATEDVFKNYRGQVKIKGTVNSIFDGKGKDITDIAQGNTELKETIVNLTSNVFNITKDSKNESTDITVTLSNDCNSIDITGKVKNKTWTSILYSNAELKGTGEKISEVAVDVPDEVIPDPEPNPNPTPNELTTKEVFYGTVNFWMENDVQSQLSKFASEVKKAGLTGTIIELLGPYKQFNTGTMSLDTIFEKYKKYLDVMNSYGLYTIVVHANWNSPYKHESLSWFTNFADKIIDYSKGKLVIYQPSSEPASSKDGTVEMKKATDLHNYYVDKGLSPLVWNSKTNKTKRYEIYDSHVSKTSSVGSIVAKYNTTNTDHSLVLKELHDGNREGQKVNIGKLKSHCELALKANTWYIMYGFWHKTPDYNAIAALGEVFKNYKQPSNPNNPNNPNPPTTNLDDLDVSGGTTQISIRNKQQPNTARITKSLNSCSIRGSNAVLSYESLSGWPEKSGNKTVNGKVHMMWVENGIIYGGHMDWLGKGQTVKTMGNVQGGYFTKTPAKGATIYFCIISLDGKERTNIKKCSSAYTYSTMGRILQLIKGVSDF